MYSGGFHCCSSLRCQARMEDITAGNWRMQPEAEHTVQCLDSSSRWMSGQWDNFFSWYFGTARSPVTVVQLGTLYISLLFLFCYVLVSHHYASNLSSFLYLSLSFSLQIENLLEQLKDKDKQLAGLRERVQGLQTDSSNTDTALATLEEALSEKVQNRGRDDGRVRMAKE